MSPILRRLSEPLHQRGQHRVPDLRNFRKLKKLTNRHSLVFTQKTPGRIFNCMQSKFEQRQETVMGV